MTDEYIKRLQGEEMWDTLHALTSYAFRPSPPLMDKEKWMEKARDKEQDIVWALFIDGEAVACAAESPMRQHIRGKTFPMSGIWGVATHPRHRRRGYAKKLLARTLHHARQQGRPVSCLYPFRESFYERLGYATFPYPQQVTLRTQKLAPVLQMDIPGEVEMGGIKKEYDRYRTFLTEYQSRVHGMALDESGHRHRAAHNEYWVAFATHRGRDVGVMLYKLTGEEITRFTMQVTQFYYHTSQGKYLLLDWIARHIDQAEEVELWLDPSSRPETWLSDLELTKQQLYIPPMGRVLDLEHVAGLKVGPGSFTARIVDQFCPWQEGLWTFESQDGRLQVRPGTEAQCTLSIHGLTALLYGTHDLASFPLRGWGDPGPDIQNTLRTMFPLKSPYLHEFF